MVRFQIPDDYKQSQFFKAHLGVVMIRKVNSNFFITITDPYGTVLFSTTAGRLNLYGKSKRMKLSYGTKGIFIRNIRK